MNLPCKKPLDRAVAMFFMRPSSVGEGPHIALHSVCPSVCPSVPCLLTLEHRSRVFVNLADVRYLLFCLHIRAAYSTAISAAQACFFYRGERNFSPKVGSLKSAGPRVGFWEGQPTLSLPPPLQLGDLRSAIRSPAESGTEFWPSNSFHAF